MELRLITDNRDTAVGMRLAGIEYTLVQTREECENAIKSFTADKDIGIILITQGIYEKCADIIDEIRKTVTLPLITEIPDSGSKFESNAITRCLSDAMGI
ncbi:MAG: V-type ATP synthase subunit F [Clostridia bacterium]|nr:V-type ATP synthase subunit F [Clostridia bacterium]